MSSVKHDENKIKSSGKLDGDKGGGKKVISGSKPIKDKPNYKIWKRTSFLFYVMGTFFLIGLSSYLFLKTDSFSNATIAVENMAIG